jgi:plasmid stabilization system protein ParE
VHKYAVRITPSALNDIEELAGFYLEMVDEASAEKFSDDVVETLESLAAFPEGHAYFDEELGLRRVRLKYHKVSIIYIVENGVYEVVAVGAIHALGEPSKYTERLVERLKTIGDTIR